MQKFSIEESIAEAAVLQSEEHNVFIQSSILLADLKGAEGTNAATTSGMDGVRRNWQLAISILDSGCETQTFPHPDIASYNSAISACGKSAQWHEALKVFETVATSKLRPTVISWSAAVSSCEKGVAWTEALALLRGMARRNVQADVFTYSALVTAGGKALYWNAAIAVMFVMKHRELQPNLVTYNAAMSALVEGGEWFRSVEIMEGFYKHQLQPDIVSFGAAVSAHGRGRSWERSCYLLEELRECRLRLDLVTYNSALIACEAAGQWRQTLLLIEAMAIDRLRGDVISFSAAVSACDRRGRWQSALFPEAGLNRLLSRGLRPDGFSFGPVIRGHERQGDSARADGWCIRMNALGVQVGHKPRDLSRRRATLGDPKSTRCGDIDESYRHTLIIERSEKVENENEDALIPASAGEDSMSLSQFPRGLEDETALRYLSDQVCCQALLNATAFEEELHKIKAFYRARHSSIIDALSGTRLDVRTCVIPQLTVSVLPGNAAPVPPPALEMQKSGSSNLMVPPTPSGGMASRCSVLKAPSRGGLTKRGSSRTVSTNADHRATRAASEAAANHPPHFLHDELAGMQDQSKLGWKLIDAALERFNKATPSCLPSAFWVIGAPGSGKNTLMCRVIMDSVSRYDNLVPLRLPILDLAKRSTDQMPELALPSVQAWFDKYLRILFGEDTPRYKMMKMAISMRRALFLFEGLDAAGQLREAVEILIQGFVKEGHFLLMTSRRLPQGSSLESLPEHIVAMEMQPLSDEQKRAIAHSRLGLQGLQSFNTFLTKIRRGQRGSDGGETQEQDDIFGNPMMLSMLLCYLSPKAGDETEQRSPATDGEGVDLMAVYRVSVTVMLKRMLLQQQADRHINEELLEDCSRVLERAAMNMQAKRDTQIECEAFEKELTIQLKERWTKNLRASVDLGRAMLLRMHREGNRTMIRFMIKGFQDYFSACAISKGDDSDHLLDQVSYQALLKDGWWAQMLDMLAQAWPKQYVQLMEKKIDKFKDEHGGSALHLAAKVGHVPIFRLVKKFSDANQVLSAKNAEDQTPLHVAAENGHHAVCQLIIEKKGSVDVEDSKERLPLHLALQSGHFSLARFLLDKLEEEASLQPAAHNNQKKEDLSERLARRILSKSTGDEPLDEEDFLGEVPNIFPEMKYFRKEEQNEYKRQMASLLSVYWVCSDDYDSFARKQSTEEKLTMGSWEGLQEWAKNKVQMTPRRVAAVLVYCAIAGIGKIAPFQKHFAADATEPISALAS
eukprot:s1745_g1.t3